MTEDQARALGEQLADAIRSDNEDAGIAAVTGLITGIAINLARIAAALTRPG
jgi:hypothetical protein